MKKIIVYPVFIVSLFIATSCSDEFLETQPTEFITQDQLQEGATNNPDLIRGTVSGIYSLMFETNSGGDGGHTDFGQKSYDIFSDMLSGDMALTANNYGWHRNVANYISTVDYTRRENYMSWRYYYKIVRSANIVIGALGGNDAIPSNQENKYLMGQAKALRAYAYFYLTQFQVKGYDPAKPVLPIYTTPDQQAQPKSTTLEVYNQIVSDLNSAISLLNGFNRLTKTEINVYVAKGLLAYTYAAMGQNSQAKIITEEIINSGEFPLTTTAQLTGGFNDVNTPSWMWGVDLTINQGLDLVSWWGHMDVFTYSYAWAGDRKACDLNLYNSIPANDARKAQFSATSKIPFNKFYHPDRIPGGQRVITTDYIYMRIDEFYLLSAEVAAKSGDEATAISRLKELLANRIPDTSYIDGLSGQSLLDEIYKQTRIELWGEGKSYLAMKRNQATINRGTNHLFQAGVPVPYNDNRLTFLIPQAELLNNPYINDQND